MIFWTIVKVALRSLVANKLRSILAMLGIIIGVWAVIAVLALAAGARASVVNRLSALGTNLLVVSPGARGSGGVISGQQQNLKLPDAQAILNIKEVRMVSPVVRGNVQVKFYNKNARANLIGTSGTYFPLRNFEVEHGRTLNDSDVNRLGRVAVIGPVTATDLFGSSDPIGQTIKLNGINFRVVGILKAKGDQGWFNPDKQVFIPYSTAMKQVLGIDYLQEIDIQCKDENDLTAVQASAKTLLRSRHRLLEAEPDDFSIFNQTEVLSTVANVNLILSVLLGSIAGISLLVGGIGIMNIMLVTVTERTREIGVRKAIGARDRDILSQFLIEAIVMSGLGGLTGLLAGVLTAVVLSHFTPFALTVTPVSVALALGFSACVGVFFGFYPAWRAARMDPIEALRYE